MISIFNRVYCFITGHRWKCVDEFDAMTSAAPTFQCTRCKKREGL